MLWNPRLLLPNGRFLGSPGRLPAEVGMAWEHHSVLFHPPDREDDDGPPRSRTWSRPGSWWSRTGPAPLTEPDRVLDELYAYYRLAASRPCPDLVVVPA